MKIIKFDTNTLLKETTSNENNDMWYHGSPDTNIENFEIKNGKFSLLGAGVYFYKNIDSAKIYGENIYEVVISSNYNIAEEDFVLSPTDLKSIFDRHFEVDKEPFGIVKPIWWATDGWNYYGYDRKETVKKISEYMQKVYNYDGMKAVYPNGGLVLCLWREYNELNPKLIMQLPIK